MAFRYKANAAATGDAIDGQDWNDNQLALSGEFNGGLDRENLPEKVISTEYIQNSCFNKFYTKAQSQYTIKGDGMHWHDQVISQEFEAPDDGVVIVRWGFSFQWNTAQLMFTSLGSNFQRGCDFRILVNGIVVSISPSNSWLKDRETQYLVGTLPITAGKIKVEGQARTFLVDKNTGLRSGDPIYVIVRPRGELIVQYKRR